MRIMYVEDNAVNLGLVRRIAKMGNHEVISHANGEDALESLKSEQVDLILMDIELEGELDGIEVVKRLRARGDERPIVAVTAYAMVGDKERILAAGCNGYLPKPIPVAQFLNILAKYDPVNAPSGLAKAATATGEFKQGTVPVEKDVAKEKAPDQAEKEAKPLAEAPPEPKVSTASEQPSPSPTPAVEATDKKVEEVQSKSTAEEMMTPRTGRPTAPLRPLKPVSENKTDAVEEKSVDSPKSVDTVEEQSVTVKDTTSPIVNNPEKSTVPENTEATTDVKTSLSEKSEQVESTPKTPEIKDAVEAPPSRSDKSTASDTKMTEDTLQAKLEAKDD